MKKNKVSSYYYAASSLLIAYEIRVKSHEGCKWQAVGFMINFRFFLAM